MRADLMNYEACVDMFKWSKVRDPERGKPLRTWARIKQDGDAFVICIDHTPMLPLCRITPDNICTWVAAPKTIWSFSNTLTMALHQAVPFAILRVSKGRYKLAAYNHLTPNVFEKCRDHGIEYFEGIQFDLKTAKCLNPRVIQVDDGKRTEWLRALRKFKRAIKTRAKVGAIDGLIRKMAEQDLFNKIRKEKPEWAAQAWIDKLYDAIIDPTKIDNTLLQGIALTCVRGWWVSTPPSTQEFLETLDGICNEMSMPLRKKFGALVEVSGV